MSRRARKVGPNGKNRPTPRRDSAPSSHAPVGVSDVEDDAETLRHLLTWLALNPDQATVVQRDAESIVKRIRSEYDVGLDLLDIACRGGIDAVAVRMAIGVDPSWVPSTHEDLPEFEMYYRTAVVYATAHLYADDLEVQAGLRSEFDRSAAECLREDAVRIRGAFDVDAMVEDRRSQRRYVVEHAQQFLSRFEGGDSK